jgi:hypothetical protein
MKSSTTRSFLFSSALPLALVGAGAALAHPCEGPTLWHAHEPESAPAEAVFDREVATLALWRPGSGPILAPDLQVATGSLAEKVNQAGDHRSIIDFERYQSNGATYYALVYTPEEKAETFSADLDADALLLAFADSQNPVHDNRKRLVDFETYVSGGERRFAALFAGAPEAQTLELQLTGAALKNWVEGGGDLEPRHLVDFERVSSSGGNDNFAALFDSAGVVPPQRFFPQLSADEFHHEIHYQEKQNYRLESMETWQSPSGDTHFAALFAAAPKGEVDHLWAQACGTGCQAADEVADTISHIVGAVQEVGVAKPSLRLVDIELPMGGPGGNITTLGDTNPAPSGRAPLKARQRSKKDLVITGGT